MLAKFWRRCLLAALLSTLLAGAAKAGDPAIEDPNGLFSLKLGYQRAGAGGGDQVINGVGTPGIDFHQCLNNNCGGAPLAESVVFGRQGIPSGIRGLWRRAGSASDRP